MHCLPAYTVECYRLFTFSCFHWDRRNRFIFLYFWLFSILVDAFFTFFHFEFFFYFCVWLKNVLTFLHVTFRSFDVLIIRLLAFDLLRFWLKGIFTFRIWVFTFWLLAFGFLHMPFSIFDFLSWNHKRAMKRWDGGPGKFWRLRVRLRVKSTGSGGLVSIPGHSERNRYGMNQASL